MSRIKNIEIIRKKKSIVKDVQNNVFIIYVIIEKVDINILQKNIFCSIKKLHNKRII